MCKLTEGEEKSMINGMLDEMLSNWQEDREHKSICKLCGNEKYTYKHCRCELL